MDSIEVIQIRVGVNRVEQILGNLGRAWHSLRYAMVGNNVIYVQRLESADLKGKCMISHATDLLTKDKVLGCENAQIKVKGKAEPVSLMPLDAFCDRLLHNFRSQHSANTDV